MSQTPLMSSCPLDEDESRGHEDIKGINDITTDTELDAFSDCDCSEDLEAEFQERAAIIEFDGGLSRADAEHLAALEVFHFADAPLNVA
ncbi:MAG: hypothetical protein LC803_11380 [Acidobacteria bacterium]|nr:hypothetical protein [Acidobacteriota bacterium]